MPEALEVLFGSKTRYRIIRFFLLNAEEYSLSEISEKILIKSSKIRKDLNDFLRIKFLLFRLKKGKKYYRVNENFIFLAELKSLVIKPNVYPYSKSLREIRKVGDVKLALIGGIFLNYNRGKADLLLVADNLNKKMFQNLIAKVEAEVGKEIRYVLMSSEELKYRLNMTDRFLLDFIRGPHKEIINKVKEIIRIKRM